MIRTIALASFLLVQFPTAIYAQSVPSSEPTAACVDAAATEADRQHCIGKAAEACRKAVMGGSSVDTAICINAEIDWWNRRLGDSLANMGKRAGELDRKHIAAITRGEPKLIDDLGNFQKAWKVWSEQRCIFEATMRRGQPDRMVTASNCMLHAIAEQSLYLDAAASR